MILKIKELKYKFFAGIHQKILIVSINIGFVTQPAPNDFSKELKSKGLNYREFEVTLSHSQFTSRSGFSSLDKLL